jgi:ATP-dependent protease ClpP protease subunit
MREFELTQKRMMAHYVKCTGLPEDIIRHKLLPPNDVWLSAEEALELKVCDRIAELNH